MNARDTTCSPIIGPILWGHSGFLCHALSFLSLWTSILHSPGVATVARRLRIDVHDNDNNDNA